ncbi:ubiquinone/menaquinone biosynthesis C-methylase UbiE [Dysgonomonas alginatilytica]|uniref:Ubiquinone/menaquinone biosynthesis C-methylase UbiE n=1 Tax=Dysgonomonas alginatilytica TaxID=1605892 RepID=A0A2V3PQJ8_9BACT|nr:methyltransferase domain-containing protein [Dysgonomonas alginatilytica]PXV59370.1 ubiquinone/menaquinone biosynthesis C-methylase UbiE [Dysgonomonas alginatilytica]
MDQKSFDKYAEKYDAWFMENEHVLYSEVRLVAHFLKNAGRILSVGCGSGLFEMILEKEFGITIKEGIEPSVDMSEIATKRGLSVKISTAEDAECGVEVYDTILYNGCPGYISDLEKALTNSYKALRKGGKVILIDIPKESSYGLLYNLAKSVGRWDHPLLKDVFPRNPYPIELVEKANWRTTAEKITSMQNVGFTDFEYAQTLTKHPIYSNNMVEEPVSGYDCGDYVAICGYKK